MALQLRELTDGLIAFLEAQPNGTSQQFISAAVGQELGTQTEVTGFLQAIGEVMVEVGFLDEASWSALTTRVAGIGIDRFKAILLSGMGKLSASSSLKQIILQSTVEQATEAIEQAQDKLTQLDAAVAWITANMPEEEGREIALEAIANGRKVYVATVNMFGREKDRALEELGEG